MVTLQPLMHRKAPVLFMFETECTTLKGFFFMINNYACNLTYLRVAAIHVTMITLFCACSSS